MTPVFRLRLRRGPLLALCAAVGGLNLPGAQAPVPPNVIFILADDLGDGDLGAHGNPPLKPPNLDRLRAPSVRFTDYHVAPMCTPTRGELMNGISAVRNGATVVAQGGTPIRRELPLMPQFFQDNGYATAHFGKWHPGDNYPDRAQDRGFELSVGYKGFGIDSIAGEWENDAGDDRYWRNGHLTEIKDYNTNVFFDEAMTWIGQQTKPFFIYLATTAAHEPFYVESRHEKPSEDLGKVLAHDTDVLPTLIDLCELKRMRPARFDGHSLRPLLEGHADPDPDRKVVIQYGLPGPVFQEWDSAVLWRKCRLVKGTELYVLATDPGQNSDLAAPRPAVVQTLREHYERWSAVTKPLRNPIHYVVVGSPAEPATRLTSADWLGPCAGDWQVLGRADLSLFDGWNIETTSAGNYEISLYLFPPEAATPLHQSMRSAPARPITGARLLVDGKAYMGPTAANATHARFVIPFHAGEHHRLDGQFLDRAGQPLCGAFFTVVAPVNQSAP